MTNTQKYTIAEMARINKEKGGFWFEKGAMRFFNTSIESQPTKDHIFITSEYMEDPKDKRFSLRQFYPESGDVNTLGEFQAYRTIEEAREARKTLKGGK